MIDNRSPGKASIAVMPQTFDCFTSALVQVNVMLRADRRAIDELLGNTGYVEADLLQLQLMKDSAFSGLFDHRIGERKLTLGDKLLEAYGTFWDRTSTTPAIRTRMAQQFLLHEFYHIGQNVGSNRYFLTVESAADFFGPLDYKADAFSVDTCYRSSVQATRLDVQRLTELLRCIILGGQVFSSLESHESLISGSRLRRQLIWALHYARAGCFLQEAPYEEFQILHGTTMSYASRPPLKNDLCDSPVVAREDLQPTLRIDFNLDGKSFPCHLTDNGQVDALVAALTSTAVHRASDAFRDFLEEYSELTGRPRLPVSRVPGMRSQAQPGRPSALDPCRHDLPNPRAFGLFEIEASPEVTYAIARIETTAGQIGTGYLVAADRVATCYDVVKNIPNGAPVTLWFGKLGEVRTGFLVLRDLPSDVALIRLDTPVSVPALVLSDQLPHIFEIRGYVYTTEATAVTLEGRLMIRDAVTPQGIRAFAMFSSQLERLASASIGCLRGSPVLTAGRVIGHISSAIHPENARTLGDSGYAFAVRSSNVSGLLATTASVAHLVQEPAVAEDRAITLARAFAEIEAASASADIHETLACAREAGSLVDPLRLLAAERLIGLNALSAALVVLAEVAPGPRRYQLEALALSLHGNQTRALALLQQIPTSAETAGLIGGALKRRWLQTHLDIWLRQAHHEYLSAYAAYRDPYPGINAAACSLWLRDSATSQKIAAEIATSLSVKLDRSAWDDSTLAEAHLLIGDFDTARTRYDAAAQRHAGQPRAVAAMRRQARLNLEHLGQPQHAFDDVLQVSKIAVFTGHRVDDDETRGRFPPSRVPSIGAELAQLLYDRKIRTGYSSAASGGDILFLEALLAQGGEAHVFLPFPAEDFVKTSVGDLWRSRFENVLKKVGKRVVTLSDRVPHEKGPSYRRCNDALLVAAHDEGRVLDETPMLVALVAAGSDAPMGGSREMVELWRTRSVGEVVEIDPSRTAQVATR